MLIGTETTRNFPSKKCLFQQIENILSFSTTRDQNELELTGVMIQNLPMKVFVYTCGSISDDIPSRAKCRFRFISSHNAKGIYLEFDFFFSKPKKKN